MPRPVPVSSRPRRLCIGRVAIVGAAKPMSEFSSKIGRHGTVQGEDGCVLDESTEVEEVTEANVNASGHLTIAAEEHEDCLGQLDAVYQRDDPQEHRRRAIISRQTVIQAT